jgi:hypothetical protein
MRLVAATGIALTLAAAVACGGSPSGPSGTGSLSVMLKDSPYSDANALLVTFTDVSVHKSDDAAETWTKLPFAGGATTRTCDLKKLVTAQDILGVGTLAAGHYTQLRLTVSAASLYTGFSSGNACDTTLAAPTGLIASVDVPSGIVKLNREFDVAAAGATTILVDFDGDKSVTLTGNGRYLMSPVISVVSVQ